MSRTVHLQRGTWFCKQWSKRESKQRREITPGRMVNVRCVVGCCDTMWCTIYNALTVIESMLWTNRVNNCWKEEEGGTSAQHEMRVGRFGVGRQIEC